MPLEWRRFSELIKSDGCCVIPASAGVPTPSGQVIEQRPQAVDGPSVRGSLGTLFDFDRLRGFRFCNGMSSPSVGIEFIIMEQDRREGLAHMPLNIVGQHTQKNVPAHVRFGTVPNGTDLKVDTLHAAKGLLDLSETFVGPHGIFRA